MLKLLSNNNKVLQVDDFCVVEKTSGLDELIFTISIHDEDYQYILEEAIIEYEQPYVVKAIDGGTSTAKIKCQLDLNELKADMKINYSNGNTTLWKTVVGVLPQGWVFIDESESIVQETIEGDYTPYEILVECANAYDVVFRFKPKEKKVYAYNLRKFQPLGAFASRELNLKEINYKGKSTEFFTRLYAYGKDSLSFADINDGKDYVDNFEYSNKVICAIMRDDNITTSEGLLEAAKKQVETAGIPIRSYECSVYDLAKTNPEMYSFQDFSLFSVIKLIDDVKKVSFNYQVVEYTRYPYYPEKNVITLSTSAVKIQDTVKSIKNAIENPQSSFRTSIQFAINSLATSITGYDGGNSVITHNKEGKPNGLMIMDTDSQDTAQKVLWLNLNGITYSKNGVDGPYETVWSFEEGGFIADFVIVGTMLADRIKGGTLTLGGVDNGDGVCDVLDEDGNVIVSLGKDGINILGGSIKLGDYFVVDKEGKVIVKSGRFEGEIVTNSANITGGNIQIEGVTQDVQPIMIVGDTGNIIKIGPYETCMLDPEGGYYSSLSCEGIDVGTYSGNTYSPKASLDFSGKMFSKYAYDTTTSVAPNVCVEIDGVFKRSASSSKRYKIDITGNISDELNPANLYNVPVRMFKYKEDYLPKDDSKYGKDVIGFIVEDLVEHYEIAVQYVEGEPDMWNANVLIPAMLKLIQEQNERIIRLEEKS